MSLFVAGAAIGDLGVPLFVAGAVFGDLGMSLFVAGAAFGDVGVSLFAQAQYLVQCHFLWQAQYSVKSG